MIAQFLAFFLAFCATCQGAFQEKTVGDLYCRLYGKGDPILIIHGGPPLSQEYLSPLLQLSDNNLLIFYDQRGCGRSAGAFTENQINVAAFVDDIEAIRTSLNLDKMSILGHSWGGFLAMKYAIEHPDAVDKLILIGSMPASQDEFTQFIAEVTKRLEPLHEQLKEIEATEAYLAGDPQLVEKQFKIVFQTYLFDPENIHKLHFQLSREGFLSGNKVFALLCQDIFFKPYDIHPELKKIKFPTLILHGDADPISWQFAANIHRDIPQSRFVKLEHCGHFPYVEQPEGMFSNLRAFLKSN